MFYRLIFRTINAGKSVRNEDHAAVYRGTLRAVISDENIANKVSDMMPTVPGHPHQIPVGKRITRTLLKIDSTEKSASDTKSNQTKDENRIQENGENTDKSEDKQKENKSTDPSDAQVTLEQALPLEEAVSALSLDLTSPTTPVPIEVMNHPLSPESVTSESAYATPQATPQKLKKTLREEVLPWLYFAVFDGHAGELLSLVNQLNLPSI